MPLSHGGAVQYGFIIDHGRCIGCHACTVACKAENDVPVGQFRTWVKYTERGTFPEVRRSFAVLRCNQCTEAPCVEICPVRALEKRPDGIVDIDPKACIGCKACMQGCPYDALYLNEEQGVAQKCHFCAHRVESGLAPACAVVCPTEAIVPGDFHDPESVVARTLRDEDLTARKTEAGTGPNVRYRDTESAGLDPAETHAAGGYLWANAAASLNLDVERFLALQREADEASSARTSYDVEHAPVWGLKVSAYLFTKSLAAGAALVAWARATFLGSNDPLAGGFGFAALVFLAITGVLLIADLKRPERFLYLFLRPNTRSWLVRGSWVLTAFGVVTAAWWLARAAGLDRLEPVLRWAIPIPAALTAAYTGWLFAQAKGRVLWMRRGLWLHLIVQAALAGAACVALTSFSRGGAGWAGPLLVACGAHLAFVLSESRGAPRGREAEFARAVALLERGPFAERRRFGTIALGIVLPSVLAAVVLIGVPVPGAWGAAAGLAALLGLASDEDLLVRAGQALPIS